MARLVLAFLIAAVTTACVGDSSTSPDGGNDAGVVDATQQQDSGPCAFGSAHFGGGCKFGP